MNPRHTRQFGKATEQFLWFTEAVKSGKKPLIMGNGFVVMSTAMYNELQSKANPAQIYFDEASNYPASDQNEDGGTTDGQ